ncbi:MAG: hypothetical protein AB8H79_24635 [Myxococcota bacterium]
MNMLKALNSSQLRDPRSLSRAELRKIWELRLSQLRLKPGMPLEHDFDAFVSDYQHNGLVWILWDGDAVVGTYLQRIAALDHDDRRYLVLAPDYVFMAKHLRGHTILLLAVIWLTIRPMMSHPFRRALATGGVYPPAYITWRRMLGCCWSLGDPSLSGDQSALVEATGSHIWGTNWRGDGTLTFRTIPSAKRPNSPVGIELFEAYERLNPEWKSGIALYFVTPLNARTVWTGIRRALTRGPKRKRASDAKPAPARQEPASLGTGASTTSE